MKVSLGNIFLLLACASIAMAWLTDHQTQDAQIISLNRQIDVLKDSLTNRFYALGDAGKEAFASGKTQKAGGLAQELLSLTPNYEGNWNFGNAVQDANLVLGRIAVTEGRLDDAKQFLIQAGQSPGSPQMNSFGPNMSLAQDLLKKGETDIVLEYFEHCRKFWKMDRGRLDLWSREVQAGEIPNFGGNLVY